MRLPFDPIKDQLNREKHGCSLNDAIGFDWKTAIVRRDQRFDYPEDRFQAIGQIDGTVHFLVFAMTDPPFRPISLRPADAREIAQWNAKQKARTRIPRSKTPGSAKPS